MTPEAVRAFQSDPERGLDWAGRPLVVDGVLGPRTRWALAFATLPDWRCQVVRTAQRALGVQEQPPGSNRHPQVDAWLVRCGAPLGSPWCAAFASWCLHQAGLRDVRQASALRLGAELYAVTEPWPGDLFFGSTNAKGNGHCGIVIARSPETFAGIDGNSGNRVRLTRRERAGMTFASLVEPARCPDVADAMGPLVPWAFEGTR